MSDIMDRFPSKDDLDYWDEYNDDREYKKKLFDSMEEYNVYKHNQYWEEYYDTGGDDHNEFKCNPEAYVAYKEGWFCGE